MSSLDQDKGSGNSNTDPAKVKSNNSEYPIILASGIDSLYLSIKAEWLHRNFLEYLDKEKTRAELEEKSISIEFENEDKSEEWKGIICPYGAMGYKWLLISKDYKMKIADWNESKQTIRPNIMVDISSECLWTLGPKAAAGKIISLFSGLGAKLLSVKPNRVDICVDVLLDVNLWTSAIMVDSRVTRSRKLKTNYDNSTMETITIGNGKLIARIYDKVREIKFHSKKDWMYDIWGIKNVPDSNKVIRVEFQIRREVIKELGIDTITHLFTHIENLWAYCTINWLKFQDNPGKHHTQRKTLPFWEGIQNGFRKEQDANPLIRSKAINIDTKQLFNQTHGLMTSFTAAGMAAFDPEGKLTPNMDISLSLFKQMAEREGKGEEFFSDNVDSKRAKYYRDQEKMAITLDKRKKLGFPVG